VTERRRGATGGCKRASAVIVPCAALRGPSVAVAKTTRGHSSVLLIAGAGWTARSRCGCAGRTAETSTERAALWVWHEYESRLRCWSVNVGYGIGGVSFFTSSTAFNDGTGECSSQARIGSPTAPLGMAKREETEPSRNSQRIDARETESCGPPSHRRDLKAVPLYNTTLLDVCQLGLMCSRHDEGSESTAKSH
jgi:hypothetical protein